MRKCLFRSGVDLCVITSILSRSIKIRVRWHALDQSCRSTEEPLEEERQLDLKLYPERYDHIWEGEYAKAFEGAYFANHLPAAKAGRSHRACRCESGSALQGILRSRRQRGAGRCARHL